MPTNISKKLLCPSCRGARMVLGKPKAAGILEGSDRLFWPKGKPMFTGFQVSDVVCLDCGYVGRCLSEDERAELEEKLRKA
jgi:hypothetical protein